MNEANPSILPRPLAYGAIISLAHPNEEKMVVYTDGLVKSRMYLKLMNNDGEGKSSFYRCLFQIYPAFINTYKREAMKLIEKIKSRPSGDITNFKDDIEDLTEKLTLEYKFNSEHSDKLKNSPITFHQPVQFFHLASNKFLSCKFAEADIEKENYKLELTEIPSDATNFKFLPSFKHQKESEGTIYYGDLVNIVHCSTLLDKVPFLHCAYQEAGSTIEGKGNKIQVPDFYVKSHDFLDGSDRNERDTFSLRAKLKQKTSELTHVENKKKSNKIEVNISLEKSVRWRVNLFCSAEIFNSKIEVITYGDIIWLNNTECESSIISQKNPNGISEVFAIRVDTSNSFQQFTGNTNGMWIIENKDFKKGGPIEWGSKFRLKHFTSGHYLSVKSNNGHHEIMMDSRLRKPFTDTLFQFKPLALNSSKGEAQNHVTKDSFTFLYHCDTGNYIDLKEEGNKIVVNLNPIELEENVFKIFKANSNEIWETSFLISCAPLVENYVRFLKEGLPPKEILEDPAEFKKIDRKMKNVENCIKNLNSFCNNKILNTSKDQKYGELNPVRQKVLREQYFLDVLSDVLRYSFTDEGLDKFKKAMARKDDKKKSFKGFVGKSLKLDKNDFSVNEKLICEQKLTICKLTYKLLTSVCKSNPENELHAFKFTIHYLFHIKHMPECIEFLISLIGQNSTILSTLGEGLDIPNLIEDLYNSKERRDFSSPARSINVFSNLNIKKEAQKEKERNSHMTSAMSAKESNLIFYIMNQLLYSRRDPSYLKFLSCICQSQSKGVSVNQEILFKIFTTHDELNKSTFYEIKIEREKDVFIHVSQTMIIKLDELFDKVNRDDRNKYFIEIPYIIAQLDCYSDMLLDRNYLWKTLLEKTFPINLLFNQIGDEKYSLEFRSSLCKLALTLYLDHEPLNPIIVPSLCRPFNSKNVLFPLRRTDTSYEDLALKFDNDNFVVLVKTILGILSKYKNEINNKLQQTFVGKEVTKEGDKKEGETDNNTNMAILDNILLLSVVKLLRRMIGFDLFRILDKKNDYFQIVSDCFTLLEYEKKNISASYALAKLREENYKKSKGGDKKNKVFGMITSMVDNMAELTKGMVTSFGGAIFGLKKKKSDKIQTSSSEDGNEAIYSSNPILKGLISLKNQLEQAEEDPNGEAFHETKNEILIKEEVCDLLNFMIDMRQDYLLSNALAWFDTLIGKLPKDKLGIEKIAHMTPLIEQDVLTIIPNIQKIGLESIDEKYRVENDSSLLDSFGSLALMSGVANLTRTKKKKGEVVKKGKAFKNYAGDFGMPDLDYLLKGSDDKKPTTKELLPSLLTTFYLCSDKNLENKILRLIMRSFNQREEFINNLKKLEVLLDPKDNEVYKNILSWTNELRMISESSELWLSKYFKASASMEITDQRVEKNEPRRIQTLLNRMKDNLMFNKSISTGRQSMMGHLRAYVPIVGIIRDCVFQYKKFQENQNVDPNHPVRAMLTLAHELLKCFVKNNFRTQKLLKDDISFFLSYLDVDLGQLDLLYELVRNNVSIIKEFAEMITDRILDAICKYGRNSNYLKLIKVLHKIGNEFHTENQLNFLNKLLPATLYINETTVKVFYSTLDTGNKTVSFDFIKSKPKDEPFLYHKILLEILYWIINENEATTFNLPKIRNILNPENCLQLLTIEDDIAGEFKNSPRNSSVKEMEEIGTDRKEFLKLNSVKDNSKLPISQLKPILLRILETVYLRSDKKVAEVLEFQSGLIQDFIELETQRIKHFPETMKPSIEFGKYIFAILVPFIFNYTSKLIIDSSDDNRDSKDSDSIEKFVSALVSKFNTLCIYATHDQLYTFKSLFEIYDDENNQVNKIVREKLEEYAVQKPKEEMPNNQTTFPTQHDDEEFERTNEMEEFWGAFIDKISDPRTLKKELEDEKLALSESIVKFAEIFPDEYKSTYKMNIEFKDIVQKLIRYLEFGLQNNSDAQTMISTLKILGTIIETAPKPEEMQEFFDRNGATDMLLSVLSDSNHLIEDELMNEYLVFGIKLLEGGNLTVQKAIYNYFLQHTKSEYLFASFHSIIYQQINEIRAKQDRKQRGKLNNSKLQGQDDHHLRPVILENLLRFIQLFTEGHNLDLQNYLRFQSNSRKRYDLVEAVIELLRVYAGNLVKSNFENIIKCLDTLTEFVQGPCPQNQVALIEGKFLEVASEILSLHYPKKQQSFRPTTRRATKLASAALILAVTQKEDRLERWMLERLKFKILILVISLLEMRSSNIVVRRVMRALPLEILKKNLLKIFKKYKKAYGNSYTDECLYHSEGDPREDHEHKNEYYELIIETGFYIYFLITSYLEVDIQDSDKDIQNEIREIQDLKDGDSFTDLFKNNVVGKLGSFGVTIFKSSFSQVLKLKSICSKKKSKKNKNEENDEDELDDQAKEERKFAKLIANQQLMKEAMDFFAKNSASIEVCRNKNLEKVMFIKRPYTHMITKEIKNEFGDKVDRSTPKTKVNYLIGQSEHIINIMKHEERLNLFFKKQPLLAVFANFVTLWRDLAFFLSIILNILIIGSYSDEGGRLDAPVIFGQDHVFSQSASLAIINTLGIIMTICAMFVLIFYLLKKGPLVFKEAFEDEENLTKKGLIGRFIDLILKLLKVVLTTLKTPEILYFLAYGILSIIAVVRNYFLFAFHLSEFIMRYSTLRNLIKAVHEPGRALFLTFILYIILVYCASLIAFLLFQDYFGGNCETTIDCFLNSFDYSFKANGGVGGWMDTLAQKSPGGVEAGVFDAARLIYDNIANLLISIIMVSIVAGMIIDTFGLLREKEADKNKDVMEKCFICGLSKEVFDRQTDPNNNFQTHIKRDHYLWNYLFFIAHLKDKDETEYTGIETFISNKLKNSDLSMFPFHKAMSLKNYHEDEEGRNREVINQFVNEVLEIEKGMKDIQHHYQELSVHLRKD